MLTSPRTCAPPHFSHCTGDVRLQSCKEGSFSKFMTFKTHHSVDFLGGVSECTKFAKLNIGMFFSGHSAENPRVRRLFNPVKLHAAFDNAMRNTRVLDVVGQLIGSNIHTNGNKLNLKSPGFGSPVGELCCGLTPSLAPTSIFSG